MRAVWALLFLAVGCGGASSSSTKDGTTATSRPASPRAGNTDALSVADSDPAALSSDSTGGLYGLVKDSVSGAPIAGVSVVIMRATPRADYPHALTDESGAWHLGHLEPGAHDLRLYYGASRASRNVTVTAGAATRIDLVLDFTQLNCPAPSHCLWLIEDR